MKAGFHYLSLLLAVFMAATLSPPGMTADIEDELVFYLSFDGGKVVDESPDPANVSVDAGLKVVAGKVGNALEVDAVNVVEVDHDNKLEGMENMTIAFWMKPEKNTEAGIISKRVGYQVDDSFSMYLQEQGTLIARIMGDDADRLFSITTQKGTWYHIAYVFEGGAGTHRMYIDGVLDAEGNHSKPEVPETGAQLWIGDLHRGRGWNYGGLIDEVGIWNRALSENEIKETMKGLSLSVEPQGKLTTTWAGVKR